MDAPTIEGAKRAIVAAIGEVLDAVTEPITLELVIDHAHTAEATPEQIAAAWAAITPEEATQVPAFVHTIKWSYSPPCVVALGWTQSDTVRTGLIEGSEWREGNFRPVFAPLRQIARSRPHEMPCRAQPVSTMHFPGLSALGPGHLPFFCELAQAVLAPFADRIVAAYAHNRGNGYIVALLNPHK